jgi:hypothetical protein
MGIRLDKGTQTRNTRLAMVNPWVFRWRYLKMMLHGLSRWWKMLPIFTTP